MKKKPILVASSVVLLLIAPEAASPQAPPHTPGTLCFTPYFYCVLPRPQTPGTPCVCRTSGGAEVRGVAD